MGREALQTVLDSLDGVRPVPGRDDQWTATCPVCGKEHHFYISSSLEQVLVYCQACNAPFAELVEAMGLESSDFFKGTARPRHREHTYLDRDGQPIARKVIDKQADGSKTVLWRRWDGAKFVKGLAGLKPPLFNLPDLLERDTLPVLVVEGEKDVETLKELGFLSTTAPNGAAQKDWPESYTDALRGREVIVVTDNDAAGEKYGRFMAEHLSGIAADLLVISAKELCPSLQAKGDVSDIVDAVGGWETERLLLAAISTFDLEPVENRKRSETAPAHPDIMDRFGFYRLDELTEEERQPPDFIVAGMIPVGLTFLSGAPKTRKSFMAMQLANAVGEGEPFLGHSTTQSTVAYFDLEGSKSRTASRSESMLCPASRNVLYTHSVDAKLGDGALVDWLRDLHEARPDIRLIIVDTYSRARGRVSSTGSNAYDADVELLEPLQRLAQDAKIAILCVHHMKKGGALVGDTFEAVSGSMGITGSCDSVLTLTGKGKRFEGRATLEYTPRDAIGGEMDLRFDDCLCLWEEDIATQTMESEPVIGYIIEHCPERGNAGRVFSYGEIYRSIHGRDPDGTEAADEVKEAVARFKNQLFLERQIAAVVGAKSNGERGVRVVNAA